VDDEDLHLDVGTQLLGQMNCRVLTAKTVKAALDLFNQSEDPIDIVIIDIIMPDMGAGDAFKKMKDMDPDVKVYLSSDYALEGKAGEILGKGYTGFIRKPFSLEEISKKVTFT
jgi:DNA-binding NtrC family response regulator